MHIIDRYLFDPERMIIYDSGLDKEKIAKINEYIPQVIQGEIFESLLSKYNQETHSSHIAINAMGICTTYKCNLRCNYCGYSSTEKDNNKLPIGDVKLFIKDIIKKSKIKQLATGKQEPLIIYYTGGGEPTFDWDLFTQSVIFIEQYCSNYKVPYKLSVVTNGVLTNEQTEFLAQHFSRVLISYDGLPRIQNANRIGPNVTDSNTIVERTIRKLVNCSIPIDIKTTVWHNDCDKLKEMYQHIFSLVPLGSDITWSIYPVIPEGRALATHYRKLQKVSYDNFLSCYFDLLDNIAENEGEERINSVYCPLFARNTITHFCGAMFGDEPFLQPDGSIVLCNESKDYSVCIGSLKNGDLKYFENYDNTFLKVAVEKYDECSNCIAYRFCKGGCPIWHLRNKDLAEEPIECHATKEYWKHIIKSVIEKKFYLGWMLEKIHIPYIDEDVYKLIKKESQSEIK